MKIELTASEKLHKNLWSGGSTTQLYIFPPESRYENRDFLLRISTASIEAEKSEFTPLPGFRRILMILNGEITIRHHDKYEKHMAKFDFDTFDGAWKTSSEGKAVDFNVMIADNRQVRVWAERINAGEIRKVPMCSGSSFSACYLFKGEANVAASNETIKMKTGDFFSVENCAATDFIEIRTHQYSEFVWVELEI